MHDFDIIRFVTGQEVSRVFAAGANKGEKFFTEAGDVDTAAATPASWTTAPSSRSRRPATTAPATTCGWRCTAPQGTLGVGHDTTLAITSAEPGIEWPPGPRHWSFMERFLPAYVTELTAFVDVARGATPSPCTVADALEAFRTAEACARSMASGQPVDLASIPTVRAELSVRA